MYSNLWNSCQASVCQLRFLNERNVLVDSLTGFKVDECLVTSQFAFYVDKAFKVEIVFVDKDANTPTASIQIPYREFINDMRVGVINNSGKYAIFNLDLPLFKDIPGLTLSQESNFQVGISVATLSFNYGSSNLSLKRGILSSMFSNGDGQRFIQYDGMLINGNSGSPLLDLRTGEVIGIACRRNTPLVNAYNQLIDIISNNLVELKKVEEVVLFGDVDPIQVLIANQNQLKHLASLIYKYTGCGMANAVTLDNILSYFNQSHSGNYEQEEEKKKITVNSF